MTVYEDEDYVHTLMYSCKVERNNNSRPFETFIEAFLSCREDPRTYEKDVKHYMITVSLHHHHSHPVTHGEKAHTRLSTDLVFEAIDSVPSKSRKPPPSRSRSPTMFRQILKSTTQHRRKLLINLVTRCQLQQV